MDLGISGGVLGLGYLLRKNKQEVNELPDLDKFETDLKRPGYTVPNGENVYQSNRSWEVWQQQQARADVVYNKAMDSYNSNVMIPGPPQSYFFKKVDGANKLPMEFKEVDYNEDLVHRVDSAVAQNQIRKEKTDGIVNNVEQPAHSGLYGGGFSGISLTGEPIDPRNFKHNNMIPFFGAKITQNVDEYATRGKLETFTGTSDNYRQKEEVKYMFKPQANITNVYGTGNLEGYQLDRYIVGPIRNNVAPIEQIRVGPGLNKGFTWKPSGGYQQADTLDYIIPKTTDELRTKNNPKVSYEGRVVAGKAIGGTSFKPGIVGKYRPDTFYVNSNQRYFTTVGACTGPTQRSEIQLSKNNRTTTGKKQRIGPAGPTTGSAEPKRGEVQDSRRNQLDNAGFRNADGTGQWQILKKKVSKFFFGDDDNELAEGPHDYGRSSVHNKPNVRQVTQNASYQHVSNVTGADRPMAPTAPINPDLRKSRKQYVIGNNRQLGNMDRTTYKGYVNDPNDIAKTTVKETNIHNANNGYMAPQQPAKGTAYDPNNVARTTIKETNIHNNNNGYMQAQQPAKGVAYDPNNVARTTIKETNIHNNNNGYMQAQQPAKGVAYDPNNVARTTIKETNIHNNNNGYMQAQQPSKGVAYDPNNVARTTIKETSIHNNNNGNMAPQQPNKAPAYDPDDVAKITTKETTIATNVMGNVDKQGQNTGYINQQATTEAPVTMRQTTSVNYTGNAGTKEKGQGGYQTTKVDAPNTNRQFTSDIEYTGNAGNGGESKPMSYEDVYNATLRSLREDVSKGRAPTLSGAKEGAGSVPTNMTTKRENDENNEQLQERAPQVDKIYNSLPQALPCSVTKNKTELPNNPLAQRLDPAILDSYRENPYTQPLTSASLR